MITGPLTLFAGSLVSEAGGGLGTLAGAIGDRPLTSVLGTMGWAIVVWGIRLLFTGRLITGREADERDRRYEAKVTECTQLRETVAAFSDAIETSNAMIRAIVVEGEIQERLAGRPPASTTNTVRESQGGQVNR